MTFIPGGTNTADVQAERRQVGIPFPRGTAMMRGRALVVGRTVGTRGRGISQIISTTSVSSPKEGSKIPDKSSLTCTESRVPRRAGKAAQNPSAGRAHPMPSPQQGVKRVRRSFQPGSNTPATSKDSEMPKVILEVIMAKPRPSPSVDAVLQEDWQNNPLKRLISAYDDENPQEQLVCLEEQAALYLQQGQYVQAAHLFIAAKRVAENYRLKYHAEMHYLCRLLEIEAAFDKNLNPSKEFRITDRLQSHVGFKNINRSRGAAYSYLLTGICDDVINRYFEQPVIPAIQRCLSWYLIDYLTSCIREAEGVLGNPPTHYTILSLGAMSRDELSPYPALRFAFLIENPDCKDYFRLMMRWLELKIVNVGETAFEIISKRNAKGEIVQSHSFVNNGYRLDNMGFTPSGKEGSYELIGTPNEIATTALAKRVSRNCHEMNLVNMLLFARHTHPYVESKRIAPADALYKEYIQQISQIWGVPPLERMSPQHFWHEERALQLLKNYAQESAPVPTDQKRLSLRTFGVSQQFLTPFQRILESLCLYFAIKAPTDDLPLERPIMTLDRIWNLTHRNLMTAEAGQNLARAFNLALDLRLRAQLFYESEKDRVYIGKGGEVENFYLSLDEAEDIREILRVFVPFHKMAVAFSNGDLKALEHASFYDSTLEVVEPFKDKRVEQFVSISTVPHLVSSAPPIRTKEPLESRPLFSRDRGIQRGTQRIQQHSTASPALEDTGDQEGDYFKQFEQAYFEKNVNVQLTYLEKLANYYLKRSQHTLAAHLANAALQLVNSHSSIQANKVRFLALLKTIESSFFTAETGGSCSQSKLGIAVLRNRINQVRAELRENLSSDQPVQLLQQTLTQGLEAILKDIINDLITVLGPPPGPYAVLALGSMSRNEMSPFSDVEFAFLIDSSDNKEYFRTLSRLLELRILNLGETRFNLIRPQRHGNRMIEAHSLTPNGLSIDIGGLSPRGKSGVYELIGTPGELSSYVTEEWLCCNDAEIILANALVSASLFEGDARLYSTCKQLIRQALLTDIPNECGSSFPTKCHQRRSLSLLKGHVEEFGPRLTTDRFDIRAFNVKKEFYRPFQMILECLSLYFGLEATSTVSRIDQLVKKKVITPEGAKNLQRAFEIATRLRIRAQLFYGREEENLVYAEGSEDESNFAIGSQEAEQIRETYRILIPFHRSAVEFLEGNIAAFSGSSFYDANVGQGGEQARTALRYWEAESKSIEAAALQPTSEAFWELGTTKMNLGKAGEAVEHFLRSLKLLRRKWGNTQNEQVVQCLISLGEAFREANDITQAISRTQEALQMTKNPALKSLALSSLGRCYVVQNRPLKAVIVGHQALQLAESAIRPNMQIARAHTTLGKAWRILSYEINVYKHYKQALVTNRHIYGQAPHPDLIASLYDLAKGEMTSTGPSLCIEGNDLIEDEEKGIEGIFWEILIMCDKVYGQQPHLLYALSLSNLGSFYGREHERKRNTEKAIHFHTRALEVYRRLDDDKGYAGVVFSLTRLGVAYRREFELEIAKDYLDQAFVAATQFFGNEPHVDLADCLRHLGECYTFIDPKLAIRYLEQAEAMHKVLYPYQRISVLQDIYENMTYAYRQLRNKELAMIYSKRIEECSRICPDGTLFSKDRILGDDSI